MIRFPNSPGRPSRWNAMSEQVVPDQTSRLWVERSDQCLQFQQQIFPFTRDRVEKFFDRLFRNVRPLVMILRDLKAEGFYMVNQGWRF